jgi:hypothetical protein
LGHLVEPEIKRFPEQKAEIDNDMARIFYAHEGRLAQKWDHYHRIYDRHLARFRGTSSRGAGIEVASTAR